MVSSPSSSYACTSRPALCSADQSFCLGPQRMLQPPETHSLTGEKTPRPRTARKAPYSPSCAVPTQSLGETQRICDRDGSSHAQPTLVILLFYNGTEAEGKKRFELLFRLSPVVNAAAEIPYEALNSLQNRLATPGRNYYIRVPRRTQSSSSVAISCTPRRPPSSQRARARSLARWRSSSSRSARSTHSAPRWHFARAARSASRLFWCTGSLAPHPRMRRAWPPT